MVGHSRGANVTLMYAAQAARPIPYVISISARHNMTQVSLWLLIACAIHCRLRTVVLLKGHLKHSMDDLHNLIIHGGFDWHFKSKGQPMSIRITQKEMRRFYHMDMDCVKVRLSPGNCLLYRDTLTVQRSGQCAVDAASLCSLSLHLVSTPFTASIRLEGICRSKHSRVNTDPWIHGFPLVSFYFMYNLPPPLFFFLLLFF
jgi:hypothetical protein